MWNGRAQSAEFFYAHHLIVDLISLEKWLKEEPTQYHQERPQIDWSLESIHWLLAGPERVNICIKSMNKLTRNDIYSEATTTGSTHAVSTCTCNCWSTDEEPGARDWDTHCFKDAIFDVKTGQARPIYNSARVVRAACEWVRKGWTTHWVEWWVVHWHCKTRPVKFYPYINTDNSKVYHITFVIHLRCSKKCLWENNQVWYLSDLIISCNLYSALHWLIQSQSALQIW